MFGSKKKIAKAIADELNDGKITIRLSQLDIDIISLALKSRIDYLEGTIMLYDFKKNPDEEKQKVLEAMLYETKRVQDLTTYDGQRVF